MKNLFLAIFMVFISHETFAQSKFEKAKEIIINRCSSCHGDEFTNIFESENDYIREDYVVPGDLKNSLLFARLKKDNWPVHERGEAPQGAGRPSMPRPSKAPALSADELTTIADWILGMTQDDAAMDAIANETQNTVQASPRLGDRFFINNKVKHLFGKSQENKIGFYILRRGEDFGGACDVYNPKTNFDCVKNTQLFKASLIPTATTMSEGWRIQLCAQLSQDVKSVYYFLDQIGDSSPASNLTPAGAEKIYNRFYPGQAADAGFIQRLIQPSLDGMGQKRLAIYAVCLTPDWTAL